jgi:hypothetical protein
MLKAEKGKFERIKADWKMIEEKCLGMSCITIIDTIILHIHTNDAYT